MEGGPPQRVMRRVGAGVNVGEGVRVGVGVVVGVDEGTLVADAVAVGVSRPDIFDVPHAEIIESKRR